MPSDRFTQPGTDRTRLFEEAVGQTEELDVVDADRSACGDLFGGAAGSDRSGSRCRAPRFAVGHQHVGDPFALPGPPGDGGRRSVLHVVGVRDDGEGRLPILRNGLETRHSVQT